MVDVSKEFEEFVEEAATLDIGELRIAPTGEPMPEQDRITVNVWVTHECLGQDPVTCMLNTAWLLETTEEQPYMRRLKLGLEPVLLDVGWVEHPGLVVVENRVGGRRVVNPTEEQRQLEEKSLVFVNGFKVRPGMPFLAELTDQEVYLRAAVPDTPIQVWVFPK